MKQKKVSPVSSSGKVVQHELSYELLYSIASIEGQPRKKENVAKLGIQGV